MDIPVSVVIATGDRPEKLANLLASLWAQKGRAAELVVVDASSDGRTRALCENSEDSAARVTYARAVERGAGAQRNQGVSLSSKPFVLFADDDVVMEPGCLGALYEALASDGGLGGASALITNQQYHPLGRISRRFFAWLNGGDMDDFSGRCIGPAVGFLSWDAPGRAEIAPIDWAPTTCVMYRREALPDPVFDPFFKAYSLVEDMALSLVVARRWRLANMRGARVYHDRVKGEIKCGARQFAAIEMVGRHYIMARVLGKDGAGDHLRFAAYQAFMLLSLLRTPLGRRILVPSLVGKLQALPRVIETAWRMGCY
ncbi:MAG TPA: glycosyltransferase family A protein [Verrucomicrobiae bacterium]|nr:glycosyltransferase family A protein [Verrucomicrobiae bacterium]